MIYLLMLTAGVRAVAITKIRMDQFQKKKLVRKVVVSALMLPSPVAFSLCSSRPLTHARESRQPKRRYWHEDVSRMAERTTEATGRAVAGQRWPTQRHVACESIAEGFSVQQELKAEAQAIASSRAGVQAVEAC